jgi:hypothetical protein
MWDCDAREVVMCAVLCQGVPALFSELPLDRATVPRELYLYRVRHSDTDPLVPVSVEKRVTYNFRGTLITTRRLDLDVEGRYLLDRPFDFNKANVTTLAEFCARHRIKKKARESYER